MPIFLSYPKRTRSIAIRLAWEDSDWKTSERGFSPRVSPGLRDAGIAKLVGAPARVK